MFEVIFRLAFLRIWSGVLPQARSYKTHDVVFAAWKPTRGAQHGEAMNWCCTERRNVAAVTSPRPLASPGIRVSPVVDELARSRDSIVHCRTAERPRDARRLWSPAVLTFDFVGRMESCQVVRRGVIRRSCVSGRCEWSPKSATSPIRSLQRGDGAQVGAKHFQQGKLIQGHRVVPLSGNSWSFHHRQERDSPFAGDGHATANLDHVKQRSCRSMGQSAHPAP